MSIKEFCEQFDRVYCINLKRSVDRREYIKKYFSEIGIENYEFFDATDQTDEIVTQYFSSGMVMSYPPCFRCGKLSCGNEECNNVLIPPQVGNFISFLRLWRKIVDDNIGRVLVVEDDVRFTDYAEGTTSVMLKSDMLSKIDFVADKPILLRLGWAPTNEHRYSPTVALGKNMTRMSNICHGLTKAMAVLLLERFKKIETTSDIYLHYVVGSTVENYTVLPPIAYDMSWSGEMDSLIHPKSFRVDYLQKFHANEKERIDSLTRDVSTHFMHVLYRPLLVVGHPRCGSHYMSELLCSMGLEVPHEKMGASGISSWMFAVVDINPNAVEKYALSRKYSHFQFIVHHVRNPRDAVPGIIEENQRNSASYKFRMKHIQERYAVNLDDYSDMEKAILSYVYWNKIVEEGEVNLVIRVEDEEEKLVEFLIKNGLLSSSTQLASIHKDVISNKPNKETVSEKRTIFEPDWGRVDSKIIKLLNVQCRKYGYAEIFA